MKNVEQANESDDQASLYRLLPSVNDLLHTPGFAALIQIHSHNATTEATRAVLIRLR